MKPLTLIKICGITREQDVVNAAKLGANYIGLIFHPASKRNLTLELAQTLARCAIEHELIPVAVVVNQHLDEIHRICQATKIKTIQLHGDTAKSYTTELGNEYNLIFSCHNKNELEKATILLNPKNDFILIDSDKPGTGTTANLASLLDTPINFPYFIAGGLNIHNVKSIIKRYHPTGVDVASGVEIKPGIKSTELISEFINHARKK